MLTWPAWQALAQADLVLARDVQHEQAAALDEAAIPWQCSEFDQPRDIARQLVDRARAGSVVWLGSADGDPGLTDALAAELSRVAVAEDPPPVEVLVGSHDVPGARLLDLVAVMDRLRSPGGCPWDAAQTHESLTPYLLEEAYEAVEAVESGDRSALAEELGDVLLQVVFHARPAEEDPQEPFDIDDVAAGIVAKLVRRHPHVFADPKTRARSDETGRAVTTPEHVEANWDRIKTAEKGRRACWTASRSRCRRWPAPTPCWAGWTGPGWPPTYGLSPLTSSGAGTKRVSVARCSLWWSRRAAQESTRRPRCAPPCGVSRMSPAGPSSARGPDERLRRGDP